MDKTGWLFVLTSTGFVVFVLYLALGSYGTIPLGRDDEAPEFNGVSWVAMMFSAGMGIGLMFFGVYRKGRLQLISSAFEPLLGARANGAWGKVIDMLAIFATLFGSAASLGLGALQIRSGLQIVGGIGETGNTILVIIIAVLTPPRSSWGSLSQRGTIRPTWGTVVFWGVATGAVAAVMLLVGGADALTGLQTITIIAALPFRLVMIGMAVALLKDLRRDPKVVRRVYAAEAVNSAVISGVTQHGDDFVISIEKDPNRDGASGTPKRH